ncbi:BlaI/MecI/CopY family transcriptional regulator [Streptomonospora sp. PA3]|nr:BlaI/MecI/CopY family transcriptional regulator [Streptomonospora sp. PA3]MUL43669.1 BlaI/MecI/CopY family transcriptional regulator [Streptomonospora sp. PA3]
MLGRLETEVMGVLWAASGPMTVREVLDALNEGRKDPAAYTTVLTVLSRLVDKGALTRSEAGRGHRYTPAVPDEAALAVEDVLRTYGDSAVSHFLERAADRPDLRERLRRLAES